MTISPLNKITFTSSQISCANIFSILSLVSLWLVSLLLNRILDRNLLSFNLDARSLRSLNHNHRLSHSHRLGHGHRLGHAYRLSHSHRLTWHQGLPSLIELACDHSRLHHLHHGLLNHWLLHHGLLHHGLLHHGLLHHRLLHHWLLHHGHHIRCDDALVLHKVDLVTDAAAIAPLVPGIVLHEEYKEVLNLEVPALD